MVCLKRPYQFKFLKVSLPQNLIGPLLNTLSNTPEIISKYFCVAITLSRNSKSFETVSASRKKRNSEKRKKSVRINKSRYQINRTWTDS